MLADNPDAAGDFEADVEDIRASFFAGRETTVLKVGELGAGTRPAIQEACDSGLGLVSGKHERLGDGILAAQKTYAETGLMPELLSVYHLLGDPAMRIR